MIRNKCDDCGKNAIFNYDSERFGIRCSTHKSPKMIDVKHRKCVTCRMKRPVYNYENEKGKYCVTCKSEGMVDVENTKCLACKRKQPFFNYEDEQKGLYCFSCKLTGMVDVKSFKCTICNKRATHNYISFKAPSRCAKCKLVDMVDIRHMKCSCKRVNPVFGYEGKPATHCVKCKQQGMINVYTKKATKETIKENIEQGSKLEPEKN